MVAQEIGPWERGDRWEDMAGDEGHRDVVGSMARVSVSSVVFERDMVVVKDYFRTSQGIRGLGSG